MILSPGLLSNSNISGNSVNSDESPSIFVKDNRKFNKNKKKGGMKKKEKKQTKFERETQELERQRKETMNRANKQIQEEQMNLNLDNNYKKLSCLRFDDDPDVKIYSKANKNEARNNLNLGIIAIIYFFIYIHR